MTAGGASDLARRVAHRRSDGDVVFRTRTEGLLAAVGASDDLVGFEVDHIDEAMSEGWRVLIGGHARLVENPEELERVAGLGIEPWPGGHRETVIRIETAELSGCRIRQGSAAR